MSDKGELTKDFASDPERPTGVATSGTSSASSDASPKETHSVGESGASKSPSRFTASPPFEAEGTAAAVAAPKDAVPKPRVLPPNTALVTIAPPTKMRNATALIIAAIGLAAYWKGLSLYSEVQRDYYSHTAWLLLIGLMCVTISAFHFIGARFRKTVPDASAGKNKLAWQKPDAKTPPAESQSNIVLALLPTLPFVGVYLSIWYMTWDQVWTKLYPDLTWLFAVLFAFVSWGAYVGLKPPTEEQERKFVMPDRRVAMLVVLPFILVYGMIWFASNK